MEPQHYHAQRSADYSEKVDELKKKDRRFSMIRLTVGILFAVLLFFWFRSGGQPLVISALILIPLFFFLLNRHLRLKKELRRAERFLEINTHETGYLQGDLSPFDQGDRFMDPDHLYASDLDIFGPLSIFRHIDRTVSLGGKRKLADRLLGRDREEMAKAQEAVKEMASDPDWRQDWQVTGSLRDGGAEKMEQKIADWMSSKGKSGILSSPFLLYPLAAVCVGLIAWAAITQDDLISKWAGAVFTLNLIIVAFHTKAIKSEAEKLEDIGEYMKVQSGLLLLLEGRSFQSDILRTQTERLKSADIEASTLNSQLTDLLDRFEQMSNLLVLILLNGLFHFHLHALRRLWKWKSEHGDTLKEWISVIEEVDVWNSLGNHAYTHPSYCYPTSLAEPGLSTVSLGHPLLEGAVRVDNDLDMSDFRYVILTGSNMSGKSTFLKAIGLNLVLAQLGLPACADRLETFPFDIIASMKAFDSLLRQQSFFHAEVLRLKRVHERIRGDRPCFVLLDEILRGTNSDDKRTGTRKFLEKIGDFPSMGIIATHDVDIADLAEERPQTFEAKYFESKVTDGRLVFDYTLREGVCMTANATELMRANGII